MRYGKRRGSFLPVLTYFVERTFGPIVELGMGFCSSPYLHWSCFPGRKLVSYESNPDYYPFAKSWESDFHKIYCIKNWDDIDLRENWSIAFVDHAPDRRRVKEIKRLTHVDFVILHDSENRNDRKYKYSTLHHLFKHRYKYTLTTPNTSVWSNKYEVSNSNCFGNKFSM